MASQFESATHAAERQFLEGLRPRYEEEGYKFVIRPSGADLPSFFSSYQPDAIATKADRNLAIEVKSRASEAAQTSIRRIRELLQGHPDWRLIVAHMGAEPFQAGPLPIPDKQAVDDRIAEAKVLAADGHHRAAFLVAWALLEAALNAVKPEADKRPRSPGTVVEALAMDGYISDEVERSLRSLIVQRNRVVHGDLTVDPSEKDVALVLEAVSSTLRQA